MPVYTVNLHGENVQQEFEGELCRLGFFTVRHVEADSVQAAAEAGLAALRESAELLERAENPPDDPPVLQVESVVACDAIDPAAPLPALSWYADE